MQRIVWKTQSRLTNLRWRRNGIYLRILESLSANYFWTSRCKKLLVDLGWSEIQILIQKTCYNSRWNCLSTVYFMVSHWRHIVVPNKTQFVPSVSWGTLSCWALCSTWHTELPSLVSWVGFFLLFPGLVFFFGIVLLFCSFQHAYCCKQFFLMLGISCFHRYSDTEVDTILCMCVFE